MIQRKAACRGLHLFFTARARPGRARADAFGEDIFRQEIGTNGPDMDGKAVPHRNVPDPVGQRSHAQPGRCMPMAAARPAVGPGPPSTPPRGQVQLRRAGRLPRPAPAGRGQVKLQAAARGLPLCSSRPAAFGTGTPEGPACRPRRRDAGRCRRRRGSTSAPGCATDARLRLQLAVPGHAPRARLPRSARAGPAPVAGASQFALSRSTPCRHPTVPPSIPCAGFPPPR
jgi:hypothetical protein